MNWDTLGNIALFIMGAMVVIAFTVLIVCGLIMLVHEVRKELKK